MKMPIIDELCIFISACNILPILINTNQLIISTILRIINGNVAVLIKTNV